MPDLHDYAIMSRRILHLHKENVEDVKLLAQSQTPLTRQDLEGWSRRHKERLTEIRDTENLIKSEYSGINLIYMRHRGEKDPAIEGLELIADTMEKTVIQTENLMEAIASLFMSDTLDREMKEYMIRNLVIREPWKR